MEQVASQVQRLSHISYFSAAKHFLENGFANTYLPVILHHNVAVVPVSNAKNKCSYTVASAGPSKQIHSHVVPVEKKQRKTLHHWECLQVDSHAKKHTYISPLFLSLSHWCRVFELNCRAPFKPPLHWICMIVWELRTTSMRPTQSPNDRQP